MSKLLIIAKSVMLATVLIDMTYAKSLTSPSSLLNKWTGFYVGVNEGFVFSDVQLRSQQLGFSNPDGTCNTNEGFTTYSPGLQLGFMHQFSNTLVSGLEANLIFNTRKNNTLDCNCPNNPEVSDRFVLKNQIQPSIKARLGQILNWNQNQFLPYLTAGASFAKLHLTYTNEGNDYYSQKKNTTGSLIGAGIEWEMIKSWTLRAEYNYVHYGNSINLKIPSVYGLIDTDGTSRIALNTNNIVIAISYWI
ncbi:porin family protein [Legionella sp. km535]|uniref:outer membrane protein n=1 Tax=Legionella sp. km535 TaxID=2498107 RepID=UPI000F8D45C1|nr:outer membrane beta-barrel protein [Legionella sp. km535]RUR19194.1 porin family protein [Legionella sp. km535]